MWKVSDELGIIILQNDFLQTGLRHRFFNLSQLAETLKPTLERRLKKELNTSTVLMAISRYQKKHFPDPSKAPLEFTTKTLGEYKVIPNLFLSTFIKNELTSKELTAWKKFIQEHDGQIWISEEDKLLSLITEVGFLEEMSHTVSTKPKQVQTGLTGLLLSAPTSLKARTELLYNLLWNLTLQNAELAHLHVSTKHIFLAVPQKQFHLLIS